MHPVVALLTNGVEMDVLGISYSEFSDADREAIVAAYPRTEHFKEDIIQNFYEGIKHKPETTFGDVKADVLADKDPRFQRLNFCSVDPRFAVEELRKVPPRKRLHSPFPELYRSKELLLMTNTIYL
jgi:hypothetical protein